MPAAAMIQFPLGMPNTPFMPATIPAASVPASLARPCSTAHRRRNARLAGRGNLGAGPNPPHSGSNRRRSSSTAGVSRSGASPSPPGSRTLPVGAGSTDREAMASDSSTACSSTSLRRLSHTSPRAPWRAGTRGWS